MEGYKVIETKYEEDYPESQFIKVSGISQSSDGSSMITERHKGPNLNPLESTERTRKPDSNHPHK